MPQERLRLSQGRQGAPVHGSCIRALNVKSLMQPVWHLHPHVHAGILHGLQYWTLP